MALFLSFSFVIWFHPAVAWADGVNLTWNCADSPVKVGSTIHICLTADSEQDFRVMVVTPDSKQTFIDGQDVTFTVTQSGTHAMIGYTIDPSNGKMTGMSAQQRFEAEGEADPLSELDILKLPLLKQLKLFAESALRNGTDIHKLYDNQIIGNRGKSEFDYIASAILNEYSGDGGLFNATVEELYRLTTDRLSYVVDVSNKDSFENQTLTELEYLIKTALARITMEKANSEKESSYLRDAAITGYTTELDILVFFAENREEIFAKADLDSFGEAVGIAGALLGLINELTDVFVQYSDSQMLLSMLFEEANTYVMILDQMIDNESSNSLLCAACKNVKKEIVNQFSTRIRDFLSFSKEIYEKCMLAGEEFVIENGLDVILQEKGMDSLSGVLGGILLGSEIGKLLTLNTGRFIDAKRDLMLLSSVNVCIRTSMTQAYTNEHPALYPLTLVWINCVEAGLFSAEQYYASYADSFTQRIFNHDTTERAKKAIEDTREDERELEEIRSTLRFDFW